MKRLFLLLTLSISFSVLGYEDDWRFDEEYRPTEQRFVATEIVRELYSGGCKRCDVPTARCPRWGRCNTCPYDGSCTEIERHPEGMMESEKY